MKTYGYNTWNKHFKQITVIPTIYITKNIHYFGIGFSWLWFELGIEIK